MDFGENKNLILGAIWTICIIALSYLAFAKARSEPKANKGASLKSPREEVDVDDDDDDLKSMPEVIKSTYAKGTSNNNNNESDAAPDVHNEDFPHIPLNWNYISSEETISKSKSFYELLNKRRSTRFFDPKRKVPLETIQNIVMAAGTSPSGAHKQPWTFVVVQDEDLKQKIREAAEAEERINYEKRMSETWKNDLKPIGTNWKKEHITEAPFLIIVFKQTYGIGPKGEKQTNYYFEKSVGLATGLLIAAIHNAGLCTLTHTPTPMEFLSKILERPVNEKPYLLMPVGYPSEDCTVPDFKRKKLEEIMVLK